MKIAVIGYSGSGKSTLAEILGKKYGLPVLHMDATFWYGNWQSRTKIEQAAIVEKFLADNPDGWVIDGNYSKICPQRFSECDEVYFLNYNRFFCYGQAKKRYRKYKGTARPDCPCPEKFDLEFAIWILFRGRTKRHRKFYKKVTENANCAHTFKSRKKLIEYLNKI